MQHSYKKKPRIAITLGDPAGIGPEITAKALKHPSIQTLAEFNVVGDLSVYSHYHDPIPKTIHFCDCNVIPRFTSPKNLTPAARGHASYLYLQKAIAMIKKQESDALVTAPINKTAVITSGVTGFRGHTEMLADAFHIKNVEMMFVGGPFKTIIATRHIPLSQVTSAISTDSLLKTIYLAHACLKDIFKIKNPKIAVCGLNPHAGEDGKIGREEIDHILPAIQKAQDAKIRIAGPFAADTLFIPFNAKHYDLIIAMYHDQGLAPIKAMYFTQLVNLTIGLPFIRTSTAHGTAEDITGKNKADPSSMIEAIRLAAKLSRKMSKT